MKKQPSWLRPVAIAIAAIVGCVAPANGFGFFLKRPDAVTPLAAMFLFIAGVFALMMRVAQPPKIAIEKTHTASAVASTDFAATVVRGTLQHWGYASGWIQWPAYLLTLAAFMLLFNELAR